MTSSAIPSSRSGSPSFREITDPRLLALLALQAVQRGGFADVVVHQALQAAPLSGPDRGLFTELVYGCVRRQRTLDTLMQQFMRKVPPPPVCLALHLGFYQLRYLSQIPAAAAVHSTVDLVKQQGFVGLGGLVNGILRNYGRQAATGVDPLQLPDNPIARLGIQHSFPDWIVEIWVQQFGLEDTATLCAWMNQSPPIDLRVNLRLASVEQVQQALLGAGVATQPVGSLPQALRLQAHVGALDRLPGFKQGWWMVQDSSAQLVGHFLNPQAGEFVVDACAAPGGKAAHLAELMGDRGSLWACDRNPKRLQKIVENAERLQLNSIQTLVADARQINQFSQQADRVLLDVPCSGLGTLHRHADARWRQTPESVTTLAGLQREILEQAITWVKPGGCLVYSTCTLHPAENEALIQAFLQQHPIWQIDPAAVDSLAAEFATSQGWLQVLPHRHHMDGFFMVRLRRGA